MARCPRLVTLTAAALLAVGACGDDGDSTVATTTTSGARTSAPSTTAAEPTATTGAPELEESVIDVEVVGGEPVGGAQQVSVDSGEQVTLRVTSDTADEVHVHGYDLTEAVGPDTPLELSFVADIPGQFEVELHDSGAVLVELAIG